MGQIKFTDKNVFPVHYNGGIGDRFVEDVYEDIDIVDVLDSAGINRVNGDGALLPELPEGGGDWKYCLPFLIEKPLDRGWVYPDDKNVIKNEVVSVLVRAKNAEVCQNAIELPVFEQEVLVNGVVFDGGKLGDATCPEWRESEFKVSEDGVEVNDIRTAGEEFEIIPGEWIAPDDGKEYSVTYQNGTLTVKQCGAKGEIYARFCSDAYQINTKELYDEYIELVSSIPIGSVNCVYWNTACSYGSDSKYAYWGAPVYLRTTVSGLPSGKRLNIRLTVEFKEGDVRHFNSGIFSYYNNYYYIWMPVFILNAPDLGYIWFDNVRLKGGEFYLVGGNVKMNPLGTLEKKGAVYVNTADGYKSGKVRWNESMTGEIVNVDGIEYDVLGDQYGNVGLRYYKDENNEYHLIDSETDLGEGNTILDEDGDFYWNISNRYKLWDNTTGETSSEIRRCFVEVFEVDESGNRLEGDDYFYGSFNIALNIEYYKNEDGSRPYHKLIGFLPKKEWKNDFHGVCQVVYDDEPAYNPDISE